MTRYGYLKPGQMSHYHDPNTPNGPPDTADIASAIRDLQVFHHVEETGRLDDATMAAIRRPRCGVSDADALQHHKEEEEGGDGRTPSSDATTRERRYVINWHMWDRKLITYR